MNKLTAYWVSGVMHETSQARSMRIEAMDEQDAIIKAEALGLWVEQIQTAEAHRAEARARMPASMQKRLNQIDASMALKKQRIASGMSPQAAEAMKRRELDSDARRQRVLLIVLVILLGTCLLGMVV